MELLRRKPLTVYVGNLPMGLTERELRQEFTPFGVVLSVVIMNDPYTGSGQTRVYGFVEMASSRQAQAAISSLNGKRIGGRAIYVVEALPLTKKALLPEA